MNRGTYPLALIFFALLANQEAAAMPRVEGFVRLADEAPAPAAATATDVAVETDDFTLGGGELAPAEADDADRALYAAADRVAADMGALAALGAPGFFMVAPPAPPDGLHRESLFARASEAIRRAVVVPLRYGCAFFGRGGDDPKPVEAKEVKKPRMLTLF